MEQRFTRSIETFRVHQDRREKLRKLRGDFQPSTEDLEQAKKRYFNCGGRVTRLQVTKDTKPGVWGDFVKSRSQAS